MIMHQFGRSQHFQVYNFPIAVCNVGQAAYTSEHYYVANTN